VGDLFDKLAKDAAVDMPRRQAFRRIGGGLIGVVLAAVGLAADKSNCGRLCAICCDQNFTPPREGGDGKAHAQCIKNCHAGIGTSLEDGVVVCGPIECPGGLQG
jgi:hypothetical protein